MKKGEVIDRYGPLNGTFTSPVNNKPYSYDQRSLPYVEDTQQYHQFEIKDGFSKLKDYIINCTDTDLVNDINAYMKYKKISSYDDLLTYKGEIAAGFGSTGG